MAINKFAQALKDKKVAAVKDQQAIGKPQATIIQSTDPAKLQAQKIAENAKLKNIFIPQAQLNKAAAGLRSDTDVGITDINKLTMQGGGIKADTLAQQRQGELVGAVPYKGQLIGGQVAKTGGTEAVWNQDAYTIWSKNQKKIGGDSSIAAYKKTLGTGDVSTSVAEAPSSGTAQDFYTTEEQRAKAMIGDEWKKYAEMYKNLYGADEFQSELEKKGYQAIIDVKEKKRQADLEEQKRRIDFQNKMDEAEMQRLGEQGKSAISATEAQFAQGAEGVISASKGAIGGEFAQATAKRLGEANDRVNEAKRQRDVLVQQMNEANSMGRLEDAKMYTEMIASAENQIQQLSAAEAKARKEESAAAWDRLNQFSTISSKLSTPMFGDMSIEQISASMGVPLPVASAIKSIDNQIGLIDVNDPEYILKKAQADKAKAEIQWAGMTDDMKEFAEYQRLLKVDPEQAKQFAIKTDIDKTTTGAVALDKQIENNTKAKKYYDEFGAVPPVNSIIPYTINGDRVSIDIKNGQYNGTRTECGEFVNDIINGGPGLFGDFLKDKPINSQTAKAGSAVIFRGGPEGHLGFIESVNSDGSLNIVDSNRIKDKNGVGVIGRMTIGKGDKWYEDIVGYYDPMVANGSGVDDSEILDLATTWTPQIFGKTASEGERKDMREIFKNRLKKGMTGEEAVYDYLGWNIKQNKGFANNVLDLAKSYMITEEKGLNQIGLREIAGKINSGKLDQVIQSVEQKVWNNVKDGKDASEKETVAMGAAKYGNQIKDKMETLRVRLQVGPIGGLTGKALQKVANDPEYQKFLASLPNLVAEWRKYVSGSAVTEFEAKFSEDVLPNYKMRPDNLIAAIDEFVNGRVNEYNSYRRRYGMPEVDETTINDYKARAELYNTEVEDDLEIYQNARLYGPMTKKQFEDSLNYNSFKQQE